MEKKLRTVLSGAGFYTTLAVCLLIVGVGGYFLLLRQDGTAEDTSVQAPASAPVTDLYIPDSTPESTEPPEEPVETAAPEPVEVEIVPTVMPEADIDPTPVAAEAPRLIVDPLRGDVLMAFSVEELVYSPTLADWRIHDGVDISAKPGATVMAASPGTVSRVAEDPMMGTLVTIDHDGGYQTTYANLQETPAVAEGDTVSAGQIIGAVGTTAAAEAAQSPHLHFSVTKDGEPIDPDDFLNP